MHKGVRRNTGLKERKREAGSSSILGSAFGLCDGNMVRSCFGSEASYYSSVSIFGNRVRLFVSDLALVFF
jgi:hypothetical protein